MIPSEVKDFQNLSLLFSQFGIFIQTTNQSNLKHLTLHIANSNLSKAFGTLVFLLLLPCLLISQQRTLSRKVVPKVILKKRIRTLIEGSHGFIWMGGSGLYKFDGYTAKRYYAIGEDSISAKMSMGEVWGLLENQNGNFWIGARNGLFFYNRATDKVKKVFSEQLKDRYGDALHIYDLFEDRKGRIWIGGEDKLILMTLEKDTTFQLVQKIENYRVRLNTGVRSIREDSQGDIWAATTDGLWEVKSDLSVILHEPEKSERIRESALPMLDSEISAGDTLWLLTGEGLWNFDIRNNHFTKIPLPEYDTSSLRELLLDEQNNLWIATRKNLYIRYPNGNVRWVVGYPSILLKGINTLIKDRFGNLLAGANGEVYYLNLIADQMLPLYQVKNGPSGQDNCIYRVMQDSAGGFWFRMLRSGLGYSPTLDGNFDILLNPPANYFRDEIKDFATDADGNVWVITLTNGLYLFEKEGKSYSHFEFGDTLKTGTLGDIIADRENDRLLWFTSNFGLCALDRITLQQTWYYPKNDLPWLEANTMGFIEEDEDGHIWANLLVKGSRVIGYFDKKNRKFLADSTLINRTGLYNARQLKKVNNNEIWVATSFGLVVIDTKQKRQTYLTPEDDFPLSNVQSISPDTEGNVWITNGNKLCKYDGTAYDCFNVPDKFGGFAGCSSTLTQDGKVVFGGYNGLLVFDPKDVEKDSIVPKVVLTDFRVFNKTVDLGQAIELVKTIKIPYHDNIFSFGFSALHYHHIKGVKYLHKLEGFDKEWKETPGVEQRITYTNLSPDTYTFKVRAANSDNFWTPESEALQVQLIILPPWYRTWWAFLIYAIIIGSVLLGIRRYELRRKLAQAEAQHFKELNLVKSQLYTNVTHEFRTPLTIILGMADQIKTDPKNWFNEGLQLIQRNGKQLLSLVNQLLDLSKLESGNMPLKLVNGDIVSFLNYLTESFHSFADSKDIRLHFASDFVELKMDYDPEKLQNIVSNLLSNAVNFTPSGGDVYFDLRKINQPENTLLIQIRDNGIGVSSKHLPHIFDRFYQVDSTTTRHGEGTGIGLALTKELVKLLDGDITVESQFGQGTKFAILLPIRNLVKEVAKENLQMPSLISETIQFDKEVTQHPSNLPKRQRPLVLLIEDNKDVITYLTSFLIGEYEIITALNGKIGIEKAIELIPDLIISDVMMPEKDGFEVCATLKDDERTSHIPIILLTAKSDHNAKMEGLTKGADAYLAKPFNKEELLVRMEKLIQLRKRLQSHYEFFGKLLTIKAIESPSKEDVFLQKIIKIVEENLSDEHFGLPDLCRKATLSRSQLFRKLKALTGKSTTHFIRSIRLEKAKELLETTDMNISEVAFKVGFSSATYFTRMFKEKFNCSPGKVSKK